MQAFSMTLEEVENLPNNDFLDMLGYLKENPPMDIAGPQLLAVIAYAVTKFMGGNAEYEDFLYWRKKDIIDARLKKIDKQNRETILGIIKSMEE